MTDGLKYFTDTHLTSIGLILFFTFFIAVLFWIFRKGSKKFYNQAAKIPFNHDGFNSSDFKGGS